jgi:hypothetical protein
MSLSMLQVLDDTRAQCYLFLDTRAQCNLFLDNRAQCYLFLITKSLTEGSLVTFFLFGKHLNTDNSKMNLECLKP